MTGTITYTQGDATQPTGDDNRIIGHICNDKGGWGSGFVVALSHRDRLPEQHYRMWHRNAQRSDNHMTQPFALGQIQLVAYSTPGVFVANMVAQRGIRHDMNSPRAVSYTALEQCLTQLAEKATRLRASVHMPRIGCGLGGGNWDEIEPIIHRTLTAHGINVTVYDLGDA